MESEYRRRIRKKTEKHQNKSQRENREATKKHYEEKIAAALEGIQQETNRANDEDAPKNKGNRLWEKLGVCGLWVAAIVAVVAIVVTNNDTNNSIIAANRAWISVAGLSAEGKVDGSENIPLKIYYRNLGRSPALNFSGAFRAISIPIPKDGIKGGPNSTCDGLQPEKDALAVFPDASRNLWRETYYPKEFVTPGVALNTVAMLLQGCFIYKTMNEIHRTWFCYVVYDGKFATTVATITCPDGNGAD